MKSLFLPLLLCGLSASAAFAQSLRTEATLAAPVPIGTAMLCESGTQIIGLSNDGDIYRWTLPSRTPRKIATFPDILRIDCAAGKTIAVALPKGEVLLLDAESGAIRQRIETRERVTNIALSPDGSLLATTTNITPTRLWDAQTGALISTGETNLGAAWSVAFSPDSQVYVSADGDTVIRVYNRKGKLLYTVDGGLEEPFAVSFRADSKQFAVAGADGVIRLFDTASGKNLKSSATVANPIFGLQMSPDGKQIAARLLDDFSFKRIAVSLWDPQSSEAKPISTDATKCLGLGTNKSQLLLLTAETPNSILVSSVQ